MSTARRRLEDALAARNGARYKLRLYVVGATPASHRAITNLRAICDEYLAGRYELEVVDVREHTTLAETERIVAAPTLIKSLPLPIRTLIGDMSDRERVLLGMDLVVE
jgi:circadian clock protein KaiB